MISIEYKLCNTIRKAFHDLTKLIENEMALKVKYLRTDNGGEYKEYLNPPLMIYQIICTSKEIKGKAVRTCKPYARERRAQAVSTCKPYARPSQRTPSAAQAIRINYTYKLYILNSGKAKRRKGEQPIKPKR